MKRLWNRATGMGDALPFRVIIAYFKTRKGKNPFFCFLQKIFLELLVMFISFSTFVPSLGNPFYKQMPSILAFSQEKFFSPLFPKEKTSLFKNHGSMKILGKSFIEKQFRPWP